MKKYTITQKDLDALNPKECAFGTTKLLPNQSQIPEEFVDGGTIWHRIFNDWFFTGLPEEVRFFPKEGIDLDKAIACIAYHMKSWSPKHEHKEAGVSYMMSLLFDSIEY